ncbi:BON domain-containing protein [Streptomyces sp. NPDC101132]|uniref:BON domain-containing protein n=1 Tax=Streptomyces sp. NPDC101132 TaxID=3366110 RepID=UPI003815744C
MNGFDRAGLLGYRMEHLRERLAHEEIAELGVRVEQHGGGVLLSGVVTTEACREAVLGLAAEELAGLPWRHDLRTARADGPAHRPEELT